MKRDKEWLKDRLESSRETDMRMRKLYEPNSVVHRHFNGRLAAIDEVLDFIDELDEPEVLSLEWIDEHKVARISNLRKMTMSDVVPVGDLQNLLVPKQEEVDRAYKDGYEKGKQHTFYKGYLEGLADKEKEPEKVVVPQFVADWYESEGKRSSWWNWFYKWGRDESRTESESKTIRWMQDYNEEKFVDIFKYGYEVEEEQKYFVNILDEGIGAYLIYYPKSGNYGITGVLDDNKGITRFTEQEIKNYDERFWAFAVEVAE